MKIHLFLLPLWLIFLTSATMGQEMLKGGNMEDESAWKVSHLDSQDTTQYEFNYTDDGPSEGRGGCLHAWATVPQSTNILFWQEVTLKGGLEYTISGAFKDLGGSIQNFWCEILLSTEAPPTTPGVDYGGVTRVAFNTWDGTQPGIDGTFQDDYVKGTGPVYLVPDTLGDQATFYFSLNIGAWAGGTTRIFDVVVDELSLMGPEGTGIKDNPVSADRFELQQNYPNPFNPVTQICYSLKSDEHVTIKVYDMLGQWVTTLVDQQQPAGNYSVHWDGRNSQGHVVSNGIYLYQMQAGHFTQTRKMILVK